MGDIIWALLTAIGLAEMLAAAYLWRAFGRLAARTERIIAAVAILTQAVNPPDMRRRRKPIHPPSSRPSRPARLQPWGGRKLQALRLHDWWAWYKLYLSSAAWHRRRRRLIRLRMRTCEACGWVAPPGLDRMLNCHHLTYDRVGRERDEDLQLLCEGCHERKHPDKAANKWAKSR